jgi:hypothetical protein
MMNMLSIGLPSTLGSYLKLCTLFFGEDSAQARFIQHKVNQYGLDEEVVAEESQMLYLLTNMEEGQEATLESLIS